MKLLSGAPLTGRLLILPTNIRLGWKALPGTNTVAYHEHLSTTAIISFKILGPGADVVKLFCQQITVFPDKLECLSLRVRLEPT